MPKFKVPPTTASIAVRSVAYIEPNTSVLAYKTEATTTLKNLTVSVDISLEDLRDQVAATLTQQGVECDYTKGKLFFAPSIAGLKVNLVKDKTDLATALEKGTSKKPVHMTIGARHADFDPNDVLTDSQDSAGNIKGYRDPPMYQEPKTSKQSAKLNVENAARIKAFVDRLYGSPESPFYHGFTSYHYGVIQTHLKTMMDGPEKDDSLITNTEQGEFPDEQDWDKYSPDGTWDTAQHKRCSADLVLSRGAYKPKEGINTPPSAQWCRQQITKDTSNVVDGASSSNAMAMQERMLNQMVVSNTLMMQAVGRSPGQPPQGPSAQGPSAQGPSAPPGPSAPQGPPPPPGPSPQGPQPQGQPDHPRNEKKRKLEAALMKSLADRKALLDAKLTDSHELILNSDKRTKKYQDALAKIADEEDQELFGDDI